MEDANGGKSPGKEQAEHIEDVESVKFGRSEASKVTSPISTANETTKMRWTMELHEKFMRAVDELGGISKATPKGIRMFMNVDGLTHYHVASHLQKHRQAMSRVETSHSQSMCSSSVFSEKLMPQIASARQVNDENPETNQETESLSWSSSSSSSSVSHRADPLTKFLRLRQSEKGSQDGQRQLQLQSPAGGHFVPVVHKEKMFSVVLTPSDVVVLFISKDHAEAYFPKLSSMQKSLLLEVEDPKGNQWLFRYKYNSSIDSYLLLGGWGYFVKENMLHPGDVVSFYRGVGEQGKTKLFISWRVPIPQPMDVDRKINSSLEVDQLNTISSGATQKEASFSCLDHSWTPFDGNCTREMDAKFGSLAKFVLNIKRWKKRASARLDLDRKVGKRVIVSGSLATSSNTRKAVSSSEKEIFYSKVLTLSDVGQRHRLVVPRDLANKYFPRFTSKEKKRLLFFEDIIVGKKWKFIYCLSKCQRYALTKGWKHFLSMNALRAGDTVSFYRGVEEAKTKLFISWIRKDYVAPTLPSPSFSSNINNDALMAESLQHGDSVVQDMKLDTNPPPPFKLEQCSSDTDTSIFDAATVDDALLYCALFPPNYEFEKDTLAQVWMALGFFLHESMERLAGLFFEECLTKGYFQFSRTNLVTGESMYKFMLDIQSSPSLISKSNHIAQVEGNSNLSMVSPEVSHVSISCRDLTDSKVFRDIQRFKQLRTLIFLHGHELSFKQVPVPRDFLLSSKELRVLDLSKTRLMEVPTSIGNMKCLCLLDLSYTLIKRLPEAIGSLEKLQTLKLRGCSNISTLPKRMRKLVNLRLLDFDIFHRLRSMPEGMGDLTNIRTLSAFLVGVEDGCGIEQIKNMNNLSGSFCISRLENVLTKYEAEKACLSNKTQLKKIELHWTDSQDEDVVEYEKILSSLQPNTSLEELKISCYGGFELASWIGEPAFSNLVSITFFKCENCLALPSLGQLPSLKYLNIVDFHTLKVIDHNFYGHSGIQGYIAFPKLEKLTVENMFSLEEWSGFRSFKFPCLRNLMVKHCPKLHSLFALSSIYSLENLEISHCLVLASFPGGKLPARVETFIVEGSPLISARFFNGGQDWQKVAHIPHIWIDQKEFSL